MTIKRTYQVLASIFAIFITLYIIRADNPDLVSLAVIAIILYGIYYIIDKKYPDKK